LYLSFTKITDLEEAVDDESVIAVQENRDVKLPFRFNYVCNNFTQAPNVSGYGVFYFPDKGVIRTFLASCENTAIANLHILGGLRLQEDLDLFKSTTTVKIQELDFTKATIFSSSQIGNDKVFFSLITERRIADTVTEVINQASIYDTVLKSIDILPIKGGPFKVEDISPTGDVLLLRAYFGKDRFFVKGIGHICVASPLLFQLSRVQ